MLGCAERSCVSGGQVAGPAATKGTTAVKETNAAKSNTIRTVAASPSKSRPVTQRDPASPIKPPAKQITRPQNGEKGAQQTASPLVPKKEAAKKPVEGTLLNKPKPGQEGGNTTPSKRNGIAKREVGKLPEHGPLPKDKTLCLQPQSSTSVPSKPLATASSPTKTLKANSISHKPKQTVPPPEKPTNATSLSTKTTKSPMASIRQGATTSTTASPVKTASSLVKAQRPTYVSTKVTKTPTSPVKPANTSSAPSKPRNATPVKPPGNATSITNQVKAGKKLPTATKATSVPAKQVNNVPTAIKSVKSSPLSQKSQKGEHTKATLVKNDVSEAASIQSIHSKAGNVEMNKTEKIAELEKSHEPVIIAEEKVDVPLNYAVENTIQNYAETQSQDKEPQLLSLTQEVKSPTKQDAESEIKEEQTSEPLTLSAESLHNKQKREKPFEEQLNVLSEYIPEEPRSLELALGSDNSFEEKLEEGELSSHHLLDDVSEDKVTPSIEPPKQAIELLEEENRPIEEPIAYMDHWIYLNQSERMPMKPSDEETLTVESVEPLEDVVTSSLEQVTPLEEGAILSDDELQPVEQKSATLKEGQRESSNTLDHFNVSPIDPQNPLELLTSSTEELTPSEDEVEVLKDEDQTLQERMPSSEQLYMEELACKEDQAMQIETTTMKPVICSKEESNTQEEPFGNTIIDAEPSNAYTEKEMPLNEIPLYSADEAKHSEEGQIQSLNLLNSSEEAVGLPEEPMFVEPLQSSYEDIKSSQEEAMLSVEPLQNLVAEVEPSGDVPMFSIESMQSSAEAVHNEPMSEGSQQSAAEEVTYSCEKPTMSNEPIQSLTEIDPSLGGEPLVLLKSTLEPTNHFKLESRQSLVEEEEEEEEEEPAPTKDLLPSEADPALGGRSLVLLNSTVEPLSSYHPPTETNDDRSLLEETIGFEGSRSPVSLVESSPHIVSLENIVPHDLTEEEGNAFSNRQGEDIPSMGQPEHLIETFLSTEPVKYDEEIHGASMAESSEYVEHANEAGHIKREVIHEKLPDRSELVGEPYYMMHEPGHGPPEHLIATEKNLDSAEEEVENVSNPITLGQSDQESSVLFPEEPLTSPDELKNAFVEEAEYPEKPIQSSLELVRSADYDEEATKPSIHELMDYPKELTTLPEKSLNTAILTTSEDTAVFSSEPGNINITSPILPHYGDYLEKNESMPWTSGNHASVENPLDDPSNHVLASLDSMGSEEPMKHEVVIQPGEYEEEKNVHPPTGEETHYSLGYHVNQPLLTTDNQYSAGESEKNRDLENSSSDSHFYVTLDPTTNQGVERYIERNKSPIEVGYGSFTHEEPLNSTNILEQSNPTEILERNSSPGNHQGSPLFHTFPPSTYSLSVWPTEPNVEVSETSDFLMHPSQNVDPTDNANENEREPWVLVKEEELSDFKEEPEEKPLRPASLNQDGEVQDEQKAEEEQVERASVCSTLSDPQLAAKSSSETSTPEELRTYEDSSSGVESHSDDAATSPQTMLTPDPDLGIHMGQEEGTETPAGTPASNKAVPPPLQIVDIEGQSQSTSPIGSHDSSESNQIVRKKEMTASTESREHDYEERAKERGAQRGNDD
ncbi:uncharacterized protein [Dendropsophus ebraccatus]|uniref:uncharacterized protein n=1 Tax=Dendropsophus ebraccatus TaxID=150705 RepID=UPI003831A06B